MNDLPKSLSGHDLQCSDRELAIAIVSDVTIKRRHTNIDGVQVVGVDAVDVISALEAAGFEMKRKE